MTDNEQHFTHTPTALDDEHPPQKHTRRHNRGEGIKSALSTVAILLTAPLIAVFLTLFVFQSYQVDGESMQTTLFHNDRLLVWKVPKTWSKITGHEYIPERGDIVVFTEPALIKYGEDPGKQLIKRVVGLPGERVVVHDGKVTVYSDAHPTGFSPDDELPYGERIESTPLEGEWDVKENQIFVIGDNRNNSLDSRTFGAIDVKNIVGKLTVRVLPINEMQKF